MPEFRSDIPWQCFQLALLVVILELPAGAFCLLVRGLMGTCRGERFNFTRIQMQRVRESCSFPV